MLLYDAVHAVIIGELVTPDVEHPRYLSTGEVCVPHVQHAGAGPFRSASSAGMTASFESNMYRWMQVMLEKTLSHCFMAMCILR